MKSANPRNRPASYFAALGKPACTRNQATWAISVRRDSCIQRGPTLIRLTTLIVAIDGPAGSGKSSTARAVAERLNALFIDTGAMYRALALKSIRTGINPEESAFERVLQSSSVALQSVDDETVVLLDGEDVSGLIRSEDVSSMSSRVSKRPDVRARMVELQREVASTHVTSGGWVVMEGRDIGTVVFPDADFKFFITASPEIRAHRRALQLREKGVEVDEDALLDDIRERDQRDSSRDVAPLMQAVDAVLVDTSGLSFEEQVENILALIRGNESR